MTVKGNRWWDLTSAVLFIGVLMTSATRLFVTEWTEYLERAQYLALLGGLMGILLGQSRFSPRAVRWLSLAYTLFMVPWQLGNTMGVGIQWTERLNSLGGRMYSAASQLLNSKPVTDPILFLVAMAILYWLIGLIGGYSLMRHGNVWMAILLPGIAMLVINHYHLGYSSGTRFIGVFLLFVFLLLGRMTYIRNRATWQDEGIAMASDLGLDLGRVTLLATIVVVFVIWNIPVFGAAFSPASNFWRTVTRPWQSIRDRFSDAFSSLQSTVGVVYDLYGDTLTLGTGTRLGDDIVFTVKASEVPSSGARFYWRARSYDYYDGVWKTAPTTVKDFSPNNFKDLVLPQWDARQRIDFTFTTRNELLNTLYTPADPIDVSRPGQAIAAPGEAGTLDILSILARPALRLRESYHIVGMISAPTQAELRQAGTSYPPAIQSRYLQLPENFSPRIAELAQQITVGLTNPYDMADAITNYLRVNIQYEQTIPPPPAGTDPIEYFLFDLKQGFCNYYASAEVLMLRSVGVPARLVVGFAQGEMDNQSPNFTIRNKDGHAWPEVYFPAYGWVEFEPTVSQPARDLLPGVDQSNQNGAGDSLLPQDQNLPGGFVSRERDNPGVTATPLGGLGETTVTQIPGWVLVLLSVVTLALVGWFFWSVVRRRYHVPPLPVFLTNNFREWGIKAPRWLKQWSRRAELTPLERSYQILDHILWLFGQHSENAFTPAEKVDLVEKILPQASRPLHELLEEYQGGIYSPRPADLSRANLASRKIRRIGYRYFLVRLLTTREISSPS